MKKFVTVQKDVASSQSKNCWLFLQLGTTAVYFWRFWRLDNSDTAWRVEIGAEA